MEITVAQIPQTSAPSVAQVLLDGPIDESIIVIAYMLHVPVHTIQEVTPLLEWGQSSNLE